MMHFHFSYIGCLFLLMLFIPNILWSQNKPIGYEQYVQNENKILVFLERIGEIAVTCLALIDDLYIKAFTSWSVFLLLAFFFMLLYEMYWLRYFKSERTMHDFYSSFLQIPVAGATLPVLAFLCLGIYSQNLYLVLATIILGIGHISLHYQHQREL